MSNMKKLYVEPFTENTEQDFQEMVEKVIKTTNCVNCGRPYNDNLKVMWVDLHSGKIIWWCLIHSKMWWALKDDSK